MVISFCCGKGGTGKTTSTYNIGAALAKAGKRVLLVDNDMQGSLTLAMGYEPPDAVHDTCQSDVSGY